MFHIYSLDGVQFNVTLETLKNEEKIKSLEKNYHVRKIIDKKNTGVGDEKLSHAVKAYKDAIKITNERETILHAYSIMKSPVLTLDPEINIADAWKLFKEKKVNHMPVLSDEKKIIGILSDRDLLKCLNIINNNENNNTCKTVSDIMTNKVITAGKITDIRRIAKAMFERHIGSIPIVDDSGQLTGIITRSDILYALINYPPLDLLV